ncbi:hypothetical protein NDU88_006137 [Pleurodeles waltl]|uniref:Uncharacterized protein n=1 Tax=Pleurodeles waltl TaxID=8319 RepID=A0AAV7UP46_PLEWA|nr:hypothetical protein NDU88_006137 [Pleurodeles waltl]
MGAPVRCSPSGRRLPGVPQSRCWKSAYLIFGEMPPAVCRSRGIPALPRHVAHRSPWAQAAAERSSSRPGCSCGSFLPLPAPRERGGREKKGTVDSGLPPAALLKEGHLQRSAPLFLVWGRTLLSQGRPPQHGAPLLSLGPHVTLSGPERRSRPESAGQLPPCHELRSLPCNLTRRPPCWKQATSASRYLPFSPQVGDDHYFALSREGSGVSGVIPWLWWSRMECLLEADDGKVRSTMKVRPPSDNHVNQ